MVAPAHAPRSIFVTGGTGYIGRRLIPEMVGRGHTVRALVREGSAHKLPPGCEPVVADALDHHTYAAQVPPADTFVHLVGVAHPSPAKAAQFRSVDLASAQEAVAAATSAGIRHLLYLSVAHPAPIMQDYVAARIEAESLIRRSGLVATIVRPWYVWGPGHRWPAVLIPFYWLFGLLPPTRAGARRLGLVTIGQMIRTLAAAVEQPPSGIRTVDVPEIRQAQLRE